MPNNTQTLGLTKPLKSERYNVDVFNENADKIDRLYANTIEDLKLKTGCAVGDVVEVFGYHGKGDGANHKRKIETEDDGSGILLANGLYANLVHNGEVNVSWFGAVGDGISDDSLAIQKALDYCDTVVIDKVSKVSDQIRCNRFNQELKGDGGFISSKNENIFLNHRLDRTRESIMFSESWIGLLDALEIKNLGFNTVLCYTWGTPMELLIKNCSAVGLDVIVHSNMPNTEPSIITPTIYDEHSCVKGYYLFDEPVGNKIDGSYQDKVINYYRARTSKPLYVAEYVRMYEATPFMLKNYDVLLLDIYIPTNQPLIQYQAHCVGMLEEIKMSYNYMKIIPTIGFFKNPDFNKSESEIFESAEEIIKICNTSDISCFLWEYVMQGTVNDWVKKNSFFYEKVKEIVKKDYRNIYKIETVRFGVTPFADNNSKDYRLIPCTDTEDPQIKTTNIFEWDTVLGSDPSQYSNRVQGFLTTGLFAKGFGGTIVLNKHLSGLCVFTMYNKNNYDGLEENNLKFRIGCTDNIGYTSNFETLKFNDNVIKNTHRLSQTKKYNQVVLEITSDTNIPFPYKNLEGYITFSNI